MADLTKLDAPSLRSFIDEEVQPFKDDIVRLRGSSPERGQSLYDMSNAPAGPFVIGQMGGDSDTAGKNLVAHTTQAASAIDTVLNRHSTAFDELKKNLLGVIDSMLKTQGETLQQVEGQKFLTAIREYDGAMTGERSTGVSSSPTTTA